LTSRIDPAADQEAATMLADGVQRLPGTLVGVAIEARIDDPAGRVDADDKDRARKNLILVGEVVLSVVRLFVAEFLLS
jgi:hypothetical protein